MKPASAPAELAGVSREGIEPLRPSTKPLGPPGLQSGLWATTRRATRKCDWKDSNLHARRPTLSTWCVIPNCATVAEGARSMEYAVRSCSVLLAPCSLLQLPTETFELSRSTSERGDSANWSTWALAPRIGFDPIQPVRQTDVHSQYTSAAKYPIKESNLEHLRVKQGRCHFTNRAHAKRNRLVFPNSGMLNRTADFSFRARRVTTTPCRVK